MKTCRTVKNRLGMNLVEVTIVLVVLGVVMAGVFMMITSSTEHFHFARRQNEIDTDGRMILERMTSEIIWAGYMPAGGWDNDNWHPMVQGQNQTVEFYADYDRNTVLDNTDYRAITLVGENIRLTDRGGVVQFYGDNVTSLTYNYLDESGSVLSKPLSGDDLDDVRHIRIDLQLSMEYGNDIMQSNFHTTISPRNLGLNHNINPAFLPPPPLDGKVVYNIPDAGPTYDDTLMIDRMEFWGLDVIPLTDDSMLTYDYAGENIDMMVWRVRTAGFAHPHGVALNNVNIPIVTLNAQDAVSILSMGHTATDQMYNQMTPLCTAHPVNDFLPDSTFDVYDGVGIAWQSVFSDTLSYPDTLLTLASNINGVSGVCVKDEYVVGRRRVHFSAWDASEYTTPDGWRIFRNVIEWVIGTPPTEDYDPLGEDDFENPDDYGSTDPGYGEDAYCYLETPAVYIPPTSEITLPRLKFASVYWTRNRQAGGYLEVSDDAGTSWTYIPDSLLTSVPGGYYHQPSLGGFPGGAGIYMFMFASPGYNPANPLFNIEIVDISQFEDDTLYFRFVFGVEDKASNNQDGWVIDDICVMGIDTDLDLVRLDDWEEDGNNPRTWFHANYPTFNDDWWYLDIHAVDPIFPVEQGFAWTTWGEIGYIGPWSHGGNNDSWEIGQVAWYFPDPDPAPTPENGSHYAGTDLTWDGYYNSNEWCYLVSPGWEMDTTLAYEKIFLRFYRCVRHHASDAGHVFVSFSNDSTPPPDGSPNWINVRNFNGEDQTLWENEEIEVTDEFKNEGVGFDYYFVRFVEFSGPNIEFGGWNVDNIQVVGRNLIP